MSDGKMNKAQQYENLKREVEVIGNAHDLLMTGRFPGGAATQLFQCQGYLKGLYTHLKAECDKMAPLSLPVSESKDTPVESNAKALESNPSVAS